MKTRGMVSRYLKKQIVLFVFLLIQLSVVAQNNIIPSTKDCSGTRPPFSFVPSVLWSKPGVSNFSTPLAGDIDGDGRVEILVAGVSGNILVFDGADGASAGTIPTGMMTYSGITNPYCIVDVEGDGHAEILVVNTYTNAPTATLYTVTSAPGVRPITFGVKWNINLPTDVRM